MNDEDFAALERRLVATLDEPGRRVIRRDVLNLLAECRELRAEVGRLREPPDVSGLMTAAELEEVRSKVARAAREREAVAGLPARRTDRAALLRHIDALEALTRELFAVVADLREDHGPAAAAYERGRAEGREQAAALAGRELPASNLADLIRDIGPCRPPLPPHESEREAERLREALRGLAGTAEAASDVLLDANALGWGAELRGAAAAARKALREAT